MDGSRGLGTPIQPFGFWLLSLGKEPWFCDHWVPESQQCFRGRHRAPAPHLSPLLRLLGTVESLRQGRSCYGPILKDRAKAGDSTGHCDYQSPTVGITHLSQVTNSP